METFPASLAICAGRGIHRSQTFYHSSPYIDLSVFGIKIESDKDGLRRKYEDQS